MLGREEGGFREEIISRIDRLEQKVIQLESLTSYFERLDDDVDNLKILYGEFEIQQDFTDKLLERIIKLESGNS